MPDEKVIISGDGDQPGTRELVASYGDKFQYHGIVRERDGSGTGHALHNALLDRADEVFDGTHLMVADDDDEYTYGALEEVRRVAAIHPTRPLIFRMIYQNHSGAITWSEPRFFPGNIGAPMFVAPLHDKAKLGRFGFTHFGDFDFAEQTCSRLGDPLWRPAIIYTIRPEG